MKRVPVLASVVLVSGLLLAGCSGAPTGSSTSPSSAAPTPARSASSIDSPLAAGSTASVKTAAGSAFDVTFGSVDWDATAAVQGPNYVNPPPLPGRKYIRVPVTIKNTGTLQINPFISAMAYDVKLESGGQEYTAGSVITLTNGLTTVNTLAPGATATGDVVFTVPTNATSGVWKAGTTYVAS